MKEIKSTEEWNALAAELSKSGYRLWQWQYSAEDPEGFHVWLCASGRPDFEAVTFNKAVQDAILNYRLK